jgi:aryl-alcohol dehydrogenase-like predicted oxidoreductase
VFILGTAQLRGEYGAIGRPPARTSDADADALLRAAVDVGVDAFDTAPAYDDAEELIGSSGIALPVHTKLDPNLDPASSVERSLRSLRRERLDLVYFHTAGIALHGPESRIRELRALVGDTVERMGASVYEPEEFSAAIDDGRFDAVQLPLNVLDRRVPSDELARAQEHGLAVFARSVLLQGVLCAPPDTIPPRLTALRPFVAEVQRIAAEAGIPTLSLVVTWVRDRPGVTGLVVGARSVPELRELLAAYAAPPLPDAVREEVSQLPMPSAEALDPRRWMN